MATMSTRLRSSEDIRCVYCTKVKPKPKGKGEHVILDGLGGRGTTPEVCDDCNRVFGNTIDREFLRQSHIALRRLLDPRIAEGQFGGVQFLESEYGFWDARLFNSGALAIPSQVGIVGDRWVTLADQREQAYVEQAVEAFKAELPDFHCNILDVPEYELARLVLNPGGKKHLLRARTPEDAERVRAALKKGYVRREPFREWELPKTMKVRFSTDFNMVGRCAAKMAFNLATAVLEGETMLQGTFNPVRAYILGDDVQQGPAFADDGEQGVLVDQRYVDPWFDRPAQKAARPSDEHSIELREIRGELGAHLRLFGGAEQFVVRLGPMTGVDQAKLPFVLWRMADDDYWGGGMHWVPNGVLQRHTQQLGKP